MSVFLDFTTPEDHELHVYEQVSRQVLDDLTDGDRVVVGVLFDFGQQEVRVYTYLPTGAEKDGERCEVNGSVTRPVGPILEAKRRLREAGVV